VRATIERFPPELFLRETALTSPDEALRAIVAKIGSGDDIERLHAEYGFWWQPAPLLQKLVREGKTFADWAKENA
jgi:hypothetical protein